jgi:hypothetical protein
MSYTPMNYIIDKDNLSIYELAVKELVEHFKDDGPVYILQEANINHFFYFNREFSGRKVQFINDTQLDEVKESQNIVRAYQIECPITFKDQLQIKINHLLNVKIDLKKDEDSWLNKLQSNEREYFKNTIKRIRMYDNYKDSATLSSLIQNTHTYVIFRYNSTSTEFGVEKIETLVY